MTVTVMGGLIRDVYMEVDSYPAKGMDALIRKTENIPGGCALNVSITLKNLGLVPMIVSAVGGAPEDDTLIKYMDEHNLSSRCIKILPEETTGFCYNIIDAEGERTFLTYKGIESFFEPAMIPEKVLRTSSYLYLTGYYLQDPVYRPRIIETLKKYKAGGTTIIFDPGPLIAEIGRTGLLEVLALTGYITPNTNEWALLKSLILPDGDPINFLFTQGIDGVLLKNGKEGVDVISRNNRVHTESFRIKTVDSTGAGDSFAAGFIYGLASGKPIKKAVKTAGACGALTASVRGPHACFTNEDVERIMQEEGSDK